MKGRKHGCWKKVLRTRLFEGLRRVMADQNEKILHRLLAIDGNNECADCAAKRKLLLISGSKLDQK